MNSALPRMVHPVAAETRSSLISGVLPIASIIPLQNCIRKIPGGTPTLDDQPLGNKAESNADKMRNIAETISRQHGRVVDCIHRLLAARALCGQWRGPAVRFPSSEASG